ncbi:unnamed protein product [Gongylonema pulchrum]|uniref:Uncharacterized protein n=1 Tax=Gongylonema pulchrum TaxID=637853 RepID=A0A183EQJ4_9BILA|nr:unnamed protein product [Gongylonema pulchrum]
MPAFTGTRKNVQTLMASSGTLIQAQCNMSVEKKVELVEYTPAHAEGTPSSGADETIIDPSGINQGNEWRHAYPLCNTTSICP